MKILITGVNGFLGRPLAVALQQLGHEVIGFSRSINPGFSPDMEWIQGDLVSREGFDQICWDQLDVIYHLASMGVKPETRNWPDCSEANIQGTLNLLQAINESEACPQLIYTRSFYESALSGAVELRENAYIFTKSIASALVEEFATRYSGTVVALKLFQVYGPGDAKTTVLPYICNQLMTDQKATLGSGAGLRDWVFIDDVVVGLIEAMNQGHAGHLASYDLGSGELVSLREMAESLALLLNRAEQLVFDASRDRPDIELKEKANAFMNGWKGLVSPKEGLKALIASYQ